MGDMHFKNSRRVICNFPRSMCSLCDLELLKIKTPKVYLDCLFLTTLYVFLAKYLTDKSLGFNKLNLRTKSDTKIHTC